MKRNGKLIRKIITFVTIILLIYFIFTLISINHYLNKYGYSIKELPQTVAVYFHLSKGFTVQQTENNKSTFIGRHDDIYEKLLKKQGYKADRYGAGVFYTKNENGKQIKLSIIGTSSWCHWFRVYMLDGAKIENLL